MKVNEGKTQILCISAAANATVGSYINASSRLKSDNQLKILGFWFSDKPGVNLHVIKMEEKFRKRLWFLRHLKRSGMGNKDLLFMYLSVIRPVLDFASIAYHTLLTKDQTNRLETLQRCAFKIIYGYNCDYKTKLIETNVECLEARREEMFVNFALKASANPRVAESWFPKRPETPHFTRAPLLYEELRPKTNRLQNSPLFQMRKRLNDLNRQIYN